MIQALHQSIYHLALALAGALCLGGQAQACVRMHAHDQIDTSCAGVAARTVGRACPAIGVGLGTQERERPARSQRRVAVDGASADLQVPPRLGVVHLGIDIRAVPGHTLCRPTHRLVQVIDGTQPPLVSAADLAVVVVVARHDSDPHLMPVVSTQGRRVLDGAPAQDHACKAQPSGALLAAQHPQGGRSGGLPAASVHPDGDAPGIHLTLPVSGGEVGGTVGDGVVTHGCDLRTCLAPVLARDGSSMTNALHKSIPYFHRENRRPNPKADPAAVVGGSASSELMDSEQSKTEKNP